MQNTKSSIHFKCTNILTTSLYFNDQDKPFNHIVVNVLYSLIKMVNFIIDVEASEKSKEKNKESCTQRIYLV
jgi:hypothetical protein